MLIDSIHGISRYCIMVSSFRVVFFFFFFFYTSLPKVLYNVVFDCLNLSKRECYVEM